MSGHIPRAFVAVTPPPAVLDAVADAVVAHGAAPAGWRWTPREQWHLTLLFLGTVDDADAVTGALGGAVSGREPFALRLGGAGAFPQSRRAGVAWVGVNEGAAALASLADAVAGALAPFGHERDEARFHPHLTVARTRGRERRDARPLVTALEASPMGDPWTVDEVVLFESHTSADGAEHVVRERFALGA